MSPWYSSLKLPFKVPLDGIVLSIPVAVGGLYMVGLVAKTLAMDPEMSTIKYYEETDEKQLEKECMKWNDSWKNIFASRISQSKFGVFNNRFGNSPQ